MAESFAQQLERLRRLSRGAGDTSDYDKYDDGLSREARAALAELLRRWDLLEVDERDWPAIEKRGALVVPSGTVVD